MTRYQNRDNAEIITLIGTEEPGWVRVELFTGVQDIISDAEFAAYDAIEDAETEEDPDDEISQAFRRTQDRVAARLAAKVAENERWNAERLARLG